MGQPLPKVITGKTGGSIINRVVVPMVFPLRDAIYTGTIYTGTIFGVLISSKSIFGYVLSPIFLWHVQRMLNRSLLLR